MPNSAAQTRRSTVWKWALVVAGSLAPAFVAASVLSWVFGWAAMILAIPIAFGLARLYLRLGSREWMEKTPD